LKKKIVRNVVNDYFFMRDFGKISDRYMVPSLVIETGSKGISCSNSFHDEKLEIEEGCLKMIYSGSYTYLSVKCITSITLDGNGLCLDNYRHFEGEEGGFLLIGVKEEVGDGRV
jgi:hypothetical protein